MAWYDIKHTCGHTERVQIYGTNVHGERERKAERMAGRPCLDCQRTAELDAATKWENAIGIPNTMTGTPKQVAWARRIRYGILTDDATIDLLKHSPDSSWILDWFAEQSAAWWIDRKDSTFVSLVMENDKAIAEHCGIIGD